MFDMVLNTALGTGCTGVLKFTEVYDAVVKITSTLFSGDKVLTTTWCDYLLMILILILDYDCL